MSDRINVGSISGGQNQLGSHGHQVNQPAGQVPSQPGTAGQDGQQASEAPVYLLHVYADLVSYSRLDAAQQGHAQNLFADMLDRSLTEADVRPELAGTQNQGDARLLSLPQGTNVAKVLAVLPRYLNDELAAANLNAATHAQLRARLAMTMGPVVPARMGLAGTAPIAVVRLGDSAKLRQAMTSAPQSCLGVILDHHLYSTYVSQRFRPDLNPDEYVLVHVSEKGFESDAWIRLFG